jgi:hypothetical protein
MSMEPPEEVRQWLGELLGIAPEEGRLPLSLETWAVLGPALRAVHGAAVAAETEPATQMVLFRLEGPHSAGGQVDR